MNSSQDLTMAHQVSGGLMSDFALSPIHDDRQLPSLRRQSGLNVSDCLTSNRSHFNLLLPKSIPEVPKKHTKSVYLL